MKTAASLILFWLLTVVLGIAGCVTNVVWILKHMATGFSTEMLIALVGLFTPLGFLHGIYLWF